MPVSVTVHDPPMFAGTYLADILRANGISIKGTIRRDRTMRAGFAKSQTTVDKKWVLLAVHETPLLSVAVILAHGKQGDSMNVFTPSASAKRLQDSRRPAKEAGKTARPRQVHSWNRFVFPKASFHWMMAADCQKTTRSARTRWWRF